MQQYPLSLIPCNIIDSHDLFQSNAQTICWLEFKFQVHYDIVEQREQQSRHLYVGNVQAVPLVNLSVFEQ